MHIDQEKLNHLSAKQLSFSTHYLKQVYSLKQQQILIQDPDEFDAITTLISASKKTEMKALLFYSLQDTVQCKLFLLWPFSQQSHWFILFPNTNQTQHLYQALSDQKKKYTQH